MIILKNDILTAKIEETGAELKSLTRCGEEFIWQGDPQVWKFSAPLLFPICGALKDDRFIYEGKEYSMPKHGFARTMKFEAKKLSDVSAAFTLCSSEETKNFYPFDFKLRVIFTLTGEKLSVKYEVENTGNRTMYFSIGAHEGYGTDEGLEEYDVVFDNPISLSHAVANGPLMTEKRIPILNESRVLPLNSELFKYDALIFCDAPCRAATLRNRKSGRGVRVEFSDMKNLLLWQMYGAPYICIEPWSGIPDAESSDKKIENKTDITALEAGKTYTNEHFIIPNV